LEQKLIIFSSQGFDDRESNIQHRTIYVSKGSKLKSVGVLIVDGVAKGPWVSDEEGKVSILLPTVFFFLSLASSLSLLLSYSNFIQILFKCL